MRVAGSDGAGLVLDGYSLVRVLGQGGSAVVYLARQHSLNREVAIKVLRRDLEDPKVWRRFLREARTIAQLSGHPNVVIVHTAGRSKTGHPYMVTEYLNKGSLSGVIAAEGPLTPGAATKVGLAIADALTAAHGLGILHRDVKPGNVLLNHRDGVKLGDFGIARLLAAQAGSITDLIAFTPEHVAPEILRGEPDGPWSDVYGLASTLAESIVGRALFHRLPDERVEALLSRKLMGPLPSLPPSVPAPLADLIRRGLDPDPGRRPPLAEFRKQLAAISPASDRQIAPPSLAEALASTLPTPTVARQAPGERHQAVRATTERRRHPGRWMALAGAAGVLVTLSAAVVLLRDPGDPTSSRAPLPSSSEPSTSRLDTITEVTTITAPVTTAVTAPTSASVAATVASIAPATSPPVSSAPTQAAPAAQSPATTPTTAVWTTVISPPTTASRPPATTNGGGGGSSIVSAERAETFIREYYDAVAAGNYDTSWAQLTPEFQRGRARSYEYYVGFWNDNDIEVGDVQLVTTDDDRVVVDVALRWNDSSRYVTERFTLRPGPTGQWLIAEQIIAPS